MIDTLTLYPLDPFRLAPGFNSITAEPRELFYLLVHSLIPNTMSEKQSISSDTGNTHEPQHAVLSEAGSPVTPKNTCLFLGDISASPRLDELFLKSVFSRVTSQLEERDYQDLFSAFQTIQTVWDRLSISSPYSLTSQAAFDPQALLKLMQPCILEPNIRCAYDEMQAILDIAGALQLPKTLVTIHLIQECSSGQVEYIAKETKRLSLQLVDLELGDHRPNLTDGENYFVDEDYVRFP